MRGVVEVYRGDEKILEEPNMLMDNQGSQIAFWMSLPRGFGNIESAASLYDTSNYTIQAASLAKDAAGYSQHAHLSALSTFSGTDNELYVLSYEGSAAKAYDTEKFAYYLTQREVHLNLGILNLPYGYGDPALVQTKTIETNRVRHKILPEFSHPKMQRLEEKSTDVFGIDLGQNMNAIFLTELMGCYAPSGLVKYYVLSSLPAVSSNVAVSAEINNTDGFNSQDGQNNKAIDIAGYIKNNSEDIVDGQIAENARQYFKGLIMSYDNETWNTPNGLYSIKYVIGLVPADLLALNFFGGVYTIGLWGYDVEGMIKKGKYPPYSDYPTNNWEERAEYKLMARKTFTFDLTKHDDITQVIDPVKIIWRFNFP